MLMMPPALATKSGAQRTPRAASRSAIASSASWLFAAPATIGHLQRGRPSRGRGRRPARTGAKTSALGVSAVPASTQRAPSRSASSRLRGSMSATTSFAPAFAQQLRQRARRRARGRSRRPCGPSRSAAPSSRSQRRADRALDAERRPRARVARAAAPAREAGDVLRALGDRPPCRLADVPDVLGGDVRAAERVDRVGEVAQRRLAARAASSGVAGGSMITPLPPPSGRPATADLKVIARDSRSASRMAARVSS